MKTKFLIPILCLAFLGIADNVSAQVLTPTIELTNQEDTNVIVASYGELVRVDFTVTNGYVWATYIDDEGHEVNVQLHESKNGGWYFEVEAYFDRTITIHAENPFGTATLDVIITIQH